MVESSTEILNIGIIGHIDHGKTTILERLTGKWASQHSEELKRGITIKLGYADVEIFKDTKEGYNISGKGKKVRHISFVDAPGHEMLMATMLSGAAMMDAAILVIAANEGIKPQTREHLMAVQAKGIKNLIVVQNKIDLIKKEQALKNYEDIVNLLKGRFENVSVIPVSAQQGVNVSKILEAICDLKINRDNLDKDPIFVVARSFDINRPGTFPDKLKGTVLGGTLKQGKLKIGDKIEIRPGRLVKEANQYKYETIKTKVEGLFLGSKKIDELLPGGSASIETDLDMSIGKSDALSGNVCSYEGKLPDLVQEVELEYSLFGEIYSSSGEKMAVDKLKHGELVMISVNTTISGGIIDKIDDKKIKLNLKLPIVPFKGEGVGIARNFNNHWRLIGSGKIV